MPRWCGLESGNTIDRARPAVLPPNWRRLPPLKATLVAASGVLGDTFLNSLDQRCCHVTGRAQQHGHGLGRHGLAHHAFNALAFCIQLEGLGGRCLPVDLRAAVTSVRNSWPKAVSWYTMARSVMPMDKSFGKALRFFRVAGAHVEDGAVLGLAQRCGTALW